jgi:hypothetical protein
MNAIAAGQLGPVFNPQANTLQGRTDYFWYATTPAALSSVAPAAQSLIQIDADSQFALLAFSYQASIAAAAVTESSNVIPLVSVNIADGGSGKYLMNGPIPLGAIAGDGKRPYRLIGPRIFQPNSTINFNWTSNVAAGTSYAITLVLHGVKLYN